MSHSTSRVGRGIGQPVERPAEKPRRDTDAGSSPRRCGKEFFSQSTFSADSLTVSVQPTCSIAYITLNFFLSFFSFVRTLNPQMLAATWENTADADRNG